MSNELVFNVKANISDASANLKKVQQDLLNTGKAATTAAGQMPKLANSTGQANLALTNFGRVVQDAPFGIIGIANNIDPLIQSFTYLKASTGSTSLAFKALGASLLGPAGIAIAVSAVTSLLVVFAQKQQKANKETKEAKNDTDSYIRSLSTQKEEVLALVNIVKSEASAQNERVNALKRLNEIIPDSIGKLTQHNIATAEGVNILRKYVDALEARATAELYLNRIAENNVKLFDNRNKALAQTLIFESKALNLQARINRFEAAGKPEIAAELTKSLISLQKNYNNELAESRSTSQGILDENEELRKAYQKILPAAIELNKIGKERVKTEKDINDEIIKIGLGEKTRHEREIEALEEKIRLQEEFNSLAAQALRGGPKSKPGDQILIDTSIKSSAAQQLEAVASGLSNANNEASLLSNTINNGINGGIDTMFTALQTKNPFESFIQGAKRLLVELGAAVVKALILRAISAAIGDPSGKSGSFLSGLLSGLTKGGGGSGGLGSLAGFATGGYVSQPTLATIAENGPEFVLRPDQLGAIMNMGGGGGFEQVGVNITGEQLTVLLQRTGARRLRNV